MAEQWVPDDGGQEDASYEALIPGIYHLAVLEIECGYGGSGEGYVTWVLVVDDEVAKGSKLWHRTSMSEKAKSFPGDGFFATLRCFGLTDKLKGQTLEFEDMVAVLQEEAPGCEAIGSIRQYEYEGKVRNDVDHLWHPQEEGAPEHKTFPTAVVTPGESKGPKSGVKAPF